MKKLFQDTLNGMLKIRDLVESGEIDTEVYPLDSFSYQGCFIDDLISEFDECLKIHS